MWVTLNDGFLSAVRHRDDPDILTVRARRRDDLTKRFPGKKVHYGRRNDYPYRVFVKKAEFLTMLTEAVMDLDYGNFKDSIDKKDVKLKRFAGKVWESGLELESSDHWERVEPVDYAWNGKAPLNELRHCAKCDSMVTANMAVYYCHGTDCPHRWKKEDAREELQHGL